MLRAGGEGCVRGLQWQSTAYGKGIQQGYQKGRRLAGFGGTLSLEATDLLGTFGPQHFSTAAYTDELNNNLFTTYFAFLEGKMYFCLE